jgi:hypothetical protein
LEQDLILGRTFVSVMEEAPIGYKKSGSFVRIGKQGVL